MTTPPLRMLITGNCGSGKTWLAKAVSASTNVPLLRADQAKFALDLERSKESAVVVAPERSKEEVLRMVDAFVAGEQWIFEGIYGKLLFRCIPLATHFVWLDLPVGECLNGVRERSRRLREKLDFSMPGERFKKLLRWTETYNERDDHTSRGAHAELFENFPGQRIRLTGRGEVEKFAAGFAG